MWDNISMGNSEKRRAEKRQRGLEAMILQEIEGNPFTPKENEIFEMFAREGLSEERCRAFIMKRIEESNATDLATE